MSSTDKSPTTVRRASPTPAIKTQQSLPFELPLVASTSARTPSSTSTGLTPVTRLWLGIYLPALALEALGRDNTATARAVFDDKGGVRQVLLANAAAISAGINPGLSVNSALALLPLLELEQRDVQCERRALLSLAGWAEQFTSFVTVEAPTILLLELAGSLRLFYGLQALRQKISAGLGEQGFSAALAIAPTPLAATWLARAGQRVCIQDMLKLTSVLSVLPLTCLGWPTSVYESLYGMGISRIGDCLRLPRQGFAKRFGACRLLELDRAVGRLPDPRISYRTPERFSVDYELTEELSDSDLILNICQPLLQKLEHFLLFRQLAVQRVKFSFFHFRHATTCVSLGCVQPDRALKHWFDLLRIRFDRLLFPAPVIAIRLRAGQGQAMSVDTEVLPFNKKDRRNQNGPIEHLVERLGARIGNALVHGVTTVAEHRPQYAGRPELLLDRRPQGSPTPACWPVSRPLWMLAQPEPLTLDADRPVYQGTLVFEEGPERLETGWWDEDGIARDYFVAVNPRGMRLWVYQNRNKENGWYLHGIFA